MIVMNKVVFTPATDILGTLTCKYLVVTTLWCIFYGHPKIILEGRKSGLLFDIGKNLQFYLPSWKVGTVHAL